MTVFVYVFVKKLINQDLVQSFQINILIKTKSNFYFHSSLEIK